jgi:hypothetical protein
LIGPLSNVVVVETELDWEESLIDLTRRVRNTTVEAYANRDVPFARIAAQLASRERAESLCRVAMVIYPLKRSQSVVSFDDLGNAGYSGCLGYNPGVFEPGAVEQMMAGLGRVLHRMHETPNQRLREVVDVKKAAHQ